MDTIPYDKNSVESIFKYSQKLVGMSFKEILESDPHVNSSDIPLLYEQYNNIYSKGGLGNLIEKHFFFYNPNPEQEADFNEVGLELKLTPYVQNKNRNFFR